MNAVKNMKVLKHATFWNCTFLKLQLQYHKTQIYVQNNLISFIYRNFLKRFYLNVQS